MTAEMALRVGQAAGAHFLRGDHRHRVVIGKDTRLSGYMMESAMVAGFTSVGMDVVLLGPMPTPAVAMLTRSMRADLGVMISACHNPFADNGIKLFGPDGYKLCDEDELAIERAGRGAEARQGGADRPRPADRRCARALRPFRQVDTFPEHLRLDGLKVVVDCANGAAYHVAPEALWELGAEVVPIGVSPNGININDDCGSTHPQLLQETVVASGADIGIALDGDADRLIVVDEKGELIDGDQLMALIALGLQARGKLKGGGVVATVMSNLGLERQLGEAGPQAAPHQGRRPLRARGDAQAAAATSAASNRATSSSPTMRPPATGWSPGFRCSPRWSRPAAGERAAAPVRAAAAAAQERPLQRRRRAARGRQRRSAIAAAEAELEGRGRLVIRKSGTEPLIRVMAEGDDPALVERLVDDICEAVQTAA